MQHKFAIDLALMIFSAIGIICLQKIENDSKVNQPAPEIKQPLNANEIKKPDTEGIVIPEKKQLKLPESPAR